jgi:hypothetical protein
MASKNLPKDRHTREHESYGLSDDIERVVQNTSDPLIAATIAANIQMQYLIATGADLSGIMVNDSGEIMHNSKGSFITG